MGPKYPKYEKNVFSLITDRPQIWKKVFSLITGIKHQFPQSSGKPGLSEIYYVTIDYRDQNDRVEQTLHKRQLIHPVPPKVTRFFLARRAINVYAYLN